MLTTAETEQSIETKSTDKGLLQKNDVDVHAPVQEKTEDLAASVNRGVEAVKSTSTTQHQVLHIRVLQADQLKKVDTIGWADPYVLIYANGTKIGKTKIKKNSKAPIWNETFDVDIHHGHVDLSFKVFDWNAVAKHTFLGMVSIDANEAGAHYDRHNIKFDLQKDPSLKEKKNRHVQGNLYLSFAVMTDQEALEDSGRKVAENIQFEDSRTTALQQKLSVSTHHQMLHLHVVGCDNIKKVDIVGWSDPYCVVYANDTKIENPNYQKY